MPFGLGLAIFLFLLLGGVILIFSGIGNMLTRSSIIRPMFLMFWSKITSTVHKGSSAVGLGALKIGIGIGFLGLMLLFLAKTTTQ
ncbi:MAG: hypothetical protein HN929_13050 [Chloroflexi bacterium]|jgi:hypothetical protein|nr:hypothetical protein [Chloroflexota bacterium]MBT7082366.1 hypothetical protein [Chloroflexota bacterium]